MNSPCLAHACRLCRVLSVGGSGVVGPTFASPLLPRLRAMISLSSRSGKPAKKRVQNREYVYSHRNCSYVLS